MADDEINWEKVYRDYCRAALDGQGHLVVGFVSNPPKVGSLYENPLTVCVDGIQSSESRFYVAGASSPEAFLQQAMAYGPKPYKERYYQDLVNRTEAFLALVPVKRARKYRRQVR